MFKMIENYIENRKELSRVFVLVDSKVGPTEDDAVMIDFLKQNDKHFMVVMTKSDKPNQSELHKSTQRVAELTDDYIVVSSNKGTNIQKLQKII